ncbi:GNAT family N-acetyltransferase [Luteipulveratus mongoliensis]|uniref:GNAT family N-acetyltransferase n=1 Tax=Luteipulveratus mongoliensis TaxID=571913 RepID=UPI0006988D3A|nr:GNAT family N-acetyltransferase [Luteipulveratus mongoliensis]
MAHPTTTEVDPHDEASFRAWYDTFKSGVTDGRKAPVFSTYDALATSLRNPSPRRTRLAVAAYEGESICGAMLFEYDIEDDVDVVDVEIGVPPAARGRGVGTALWNWAVARMAALGRTIAAVELNIAPDQTLENSLGGRFALARGFVSSHVEDHLALAWPGAPRTPSSEEAYRVITWTGATPDDLIEAYAHMWTAMSADVPTGDLTRDHRIITPDRIRQSEERMARSYRSYVAFAQHSDGSPAGYTLVYVDRSDGSNAIQDDTLVLEEHRGHGLGALLKAANYAQIREAESDVRWVHTWTAQSNGAMQRVNTGFGFEVVEVMHEMELKPR